MKKLSVITVVVGMLFIHLDAHAWDWHLLGEPGLGYQVGSGEQKKVGSFQGVEQVTDQWNITGFTFIAKGGVRAFKYGFLLLDLQWSPARFNKKRGELTDRSYQNTRLGFDLGLYFPTHPRLRLWLGLNFVDKLAQPGGSETYHGSGFKLGAGYELTQDIDFPLAVNLEYINSTYGSVTIDEDEFDFPRDLVIGATHEKLTSSAILVSLTIPLSYHLKPLID